MRFDDREFIRRQLPRFKQYLILDSHFADIVQWARVKDVVDKRVVNHRGIGWLGLQLLGEELAELSCALQVFAGVVIALPLTLTSPGWWRVAHRRFPALAPGLTAVNRG